MPVAAEGRGGLTVLGRFSLAVSLLFSTGLIFVFAWLLVFGPTLALILGFTLYIVGLSVLFFFPLISVHSAMKDVRAAESEKLAMLFHEAYAQLPSGIGQLTGQERQVLRPDLERMVHYLSDLDRLHHRAVTMPVWPVSSGTVTQFVTLVVVPLLLFVLQVVSEPWVAMHVRRFIS